MRETGRHCCLGSCCFLPCPAAGPGTADRRCSAEDGRLGVGHDLLVVLQSESHLALLLPGCCSISILGYPAICTPAIRMLSLLRRPNTSANSAEYWWWRTGHLALKRRVDQPGVITKVTTMKIARPIA